MRLKEPEPEIGFFLGSASLGWEFKRGRADTDGEERGFLSLLLGWFEVVEERCVWMACIVVGIYT